MSIVKGKILSSEPISLSSASFILDKFVSSHNSINGDVFTFLKRSNASIDQLLVAKNEGKRYQDHRPHHGIHGGALQELASKASNEIIKQGLADFEAPRKGKEPKGRKPEEGDRRKHKKHKAVNDTV